MKRSEITARLGEIENRVGELNGAKDADGNPSLTDEGRKELDGLIAESETLTAQVKQLDEDALRIEKANAIGKWRDNPHPRLTASDSLAAPAVHTRHYQTKPLKGYKSADDAYLAGRWYAATLFDHGPSRLYLEKRGSECLGVQTEINPTKGAVLVPDVVSQSIIDLRLSYGVFRANARTVTMGSDTLIIPRRSGGLTTYFVAETDSITESEKTWDAVTLTARKLATLTRWSSDIDEDAMIDLASDLSSEIAYAFASKEDNCGWLGDGTSTYGGIVGVKNALLAGSKYTGITGNTAFSTLDALDFENMAGQLPDYARARAAWYIHPAAYFASMRRLMDAVGGVTAADVAAGNLPTFLGYPVRFSNVLNSTLTAQTSAVGGCYFGDLAMTATLGDRRGVTVDVDRSRYFEYDQIAIRGTQRFDIVVHEVGTASVAGPMIVLVFPGS